MSQQQTYRPEFSTPSSRFQPPSCDNLSDVPTADLKSETGTPSRAVHNKQREIYNNIQNDPTEAAEIMQYLHAKHPEIEAIGSHPPQNAQVAMVERVAEQFRELQACNERARKAAEALYYWETKGSEIQAEINITLGLDRAGRKGESLRW
ncbi:hypothetical protein ACHAQD_008387 [Fusarium lateritium]